VKFIIQLYIKVKNDHKYHLLYLTSESIDLVKFDMNQLILSYFC